jgi:prepilin-type processing-associated H-X9-DG protein
MSPCNTRGQRSGGGGRGGEVGAAYLPGTPIGIYKKSDILYCPSIQVRPLFTSDSKAQFRTYGMVNFFSDADYTNNVAAKQDKLGSFLLSSGSASFMVVKAMKIPSETILHADSGYSVDQVTEVGRSTWSFCPHWYESGETAGVMLRHNRQANVLYVDGHAAAKSATKLRQSPTRIKAFVTGDARKQYLF